MKGLLEHRRMPILAALGWLLLALSAATPGRSQADPRPTVRVSFEVFEPDVIDSLEIGELGEAVVPEMVKLLNQEVRFLRFSAQGPAEVDLRFGLGLTDAADVVHPLYLYASLSGRVIATDTALPFAIQVVSLIQAAQDPPETVDDFAQAISTGAEKLDYRDWVRGLLSRVVVARSAHPFADPVGSFWALPFRLDEVQAQIKTEFRVNSQLTVFGNPHETNSLAMACGHVGHDQSSVPEQFRDKAMAQILDANTAGLVPDASGHQLRSVQVTEYVRSFQDEARPTAGSDIDPDADAGGEDEGDTP